MKSKAIVISVLITNFFAGGSALAVDLDPNELNALLNREIQAAQEAKKNPTNSPAPESKTETTSEAKPQEKKPEVVNVLGRPGQTVTPEQYQEIVNRLVKIIGQYDDPRGVLNAKQQEGTLALTPNDVFTARIIDDAMEQAINADLVTPDVINLPYSIDVQNKYKTYDIYVHETGTTQIEFSDAKGNPWPIFNNSPVKSFEVTKPTVNTVWITPTEKYKNNNIFITLEKYPHTIQLNLIYANKQRHGLATFSVPLLGPVSKPEAIKSDKVDLNDIASGNFNSASNDVAIQISDINQTDLIYLAETGYFEPGSEAYTDAKSVVVNDRSIASVWFYKDKFIVRSPYGIDSNYENVINPNGVNKVYVAKNLNSILRFYSGTNEYELILPDYHRYRSGW